MNSASLSVWVVDSDSSTILCTIADNTANKAADNKLADQPTNKPKSAGITPACLCLADTILRHLPPYCYAKPLNDKLYLSCQGYHDEHSLIPDVVIELSALIQLGIIKPNGNQHYRQGQHHYAAFAYRKLISYLDSDTAAIASHAIQLLRWRHDHRYCSRCATMLDTHKSEYALVCPKCRYRSYPRIQPCVITAITRTQANKKQILLALHHRHHDTDKANSMHGLIAGFVEIGENLAAAVQRETLEETGLSVDNIRYIDSQAWPYPSNLMIGFVADYTAGEIMVDSRELVYAKFFDLDNLPVIPPVGTIARTLIDRVIKTN